MKERQQNTSLQAEPSFPAGSFSSTGINRSFNKQEKKAVLEVNKFGERSQIERSTIASGDNYRDKAPFINSAVDGSHEKIVTSSGLQRNYSENRFPNSAVPITSYVDPTYAVSAFRQSPPDRLCFGVQDCFPLTRCQVGAPAGIANGGQLAFNKTDSVSSEGFSLLQHAGGSSTAGLQEVTESRRVGGVVALSCAVPGLHVLLLCQGAAFQSSNDSHVFKPHWEGSAILSANSKKALSGKESCDTRTYTYLQQSIMDFKALVSMMPGGASNYRSFPIYTIRQRFCASSSKGTGITANTFIPSGIPMTSAGEYSNSRRISVAHGVVGQNYLMSPGLAPRESPSQLRGHGVKEDYDSEAAAAPNSNIVLRGTNTNLVITTPFVRYVNFLVHEDTEPEEFCALVVDAVNDSHENNRTGWVQKQHEQKTAISSAKQSETSARTSPRASDIERVIQPSTSVQCEVRNQILAVPLEGVIDGCREDVLSQNQGDATSCKILMKSPVDYLFLPDKVLNKSKASIGISFLTHTYETEKDIFERAFMNTDKNIKCADTSLRQSDNLSFTADTCDVSRSGINLEEEHKDEEFALLPSELTEKMIEPITAVAEEMLDEELASIDGFTSKKPHRVTVIVVQQFERSSPKLLSAIMDLMVCGFVRNPDTGVPFDTHSVRIAAVTYSERLAALLPSHVREIFALSAAFSQQTLRRPRHCNVPRENLEQLITMRHALMFFVDNDQVTLCGPAARDYFTNILRVLSLESVPNALQLSKLVENHEFWLRIFCTLAFLFRGNYTQYLPRQQNTRDDSRMEGTPKSGVLPDRVPTRTGNTALSSGARSLSTSFWPSANTTFAVDFEHSVADKSGFPVRKRVYVNSTDILCLIPHISAHRMCVDRLEYYTLTNNDPVVCTSLYPVVGFTGLGATAVGAAQDTEYLGTPAVEGGRGSGDIVPAVQFVSKTLATVSGEKIDFREPRGVLERQRLEDFGGLFRCCSYFTNEGVDSQMGRKGGVQESSSWTVTDSSMAHQGCRGRRVSSLASCGEVLATSCNKGVNAVSNGDGTRPNSFACYVEKEIFFPASSWDVVAAYCDSIRRHDVPVYNRLYGFNIALQQKAAHEPEEKHERAGSDFKGEHNAKSSSALGSVGLCEKYPLNSLLGAMRDSEAMSYYDLPVTSEESQLKNNGRIAAQNMPAAECELSSGFSGSGYRGGLGAGMPGGAFRSGGEQESSVMRFLTYSECFDLVNRILLDKGILPLG